MSKKKLKHIAPLLHTLKSKKAGFRTPNGYFESFDTKITSLLFKEKSNPYKLPENYFDTIEDLVISKLKAEKLNTENKTNTIPENYFENFEDRVINKIKPVEKPTKVIAFNTAFIKKAAMIAVAASFILYFGIVPIFNTNNSVDFNTVSTIDLDYWLENENVTISNDEIASIFNDDEISEISNTLLTSEYNDDEIIDFLDNHDIESLLTED